MLVASEQKNSDESVDSTVPAVSLVIAAVPVQYRVTNLFDFIYNHDEPEKVLESICYRELTKYAVSAKLEMENEYFGSDIESVGNQSLLGKGRIEAADTLTQRIQLAADNEGLGVEIVFLGLQGVHPPVEVAADYQDVTGAIQEKQSLILDALRKEIRILTTTAGSVAKAEELAALEKELQIEKEKENPDQNRISELTSQLDEAFMQASGDTYIALSKAQTYAFNKTIMAEATGQRFAGQLKAYNAAPEIYLYKQGLVMLENTLKDIRKYVIVAQEQGRQVTIIDLQNKIEQSLTEGIQEYLEQSGGQ